MLQVAIIDEQVEAALALELRALACPACSGPRRRGVRALARAVPTVRKGPRGAAHRSATRTLHPCGWGSSEPDAGRYDGDRRRFGSVARAVWRRDGARLRVQRHELPNRAREDAGMLAWPLAATHRPFPPAGPVAGRSDGGHPRSTAKRSASPITSATRHQSRRAGTPHWAGARATPSAPRSQPSPPRVLSSHAVPRVDAAPREWVASLADSRSCMSGASRVPDDAPSERSKRKRSGLNARRTAARSRPSPASLPAVRLPVRTPSPGHFVLSYPTPDAGGQGRLRNAHR